MPSRYIAASFATVCYALSLIAGLFAGRPVADVLWIGLVVLLLTYVLGSLFGGLIQTELDRAIRRHENDHPIPTSSGTRATASARSGRAD